MVHPTLTALAKRIKIDARRMGSIIESSRDFNGFYNKLKDIDPNVVASDCLEVWMTHWEMYSQS